MSKRKRETADEESATPGRRKKVKKQKTSKTRISQAKDASNTSPKHVESEEYTQLPQDRDNKKHARKLANREKGALERSQRDGLERKDEIRTGEDDEDIRLVKIRETKSLEKGHSAAAPGRHESREREEEGGQKLTVKRKPKREKRSRDRTARSNGKKNKKKDIEIATWKVSDPLGGQMLDVDPVFSPDEK